MTNETQPPLTIKIEKDRFLALIRGTTTGLASASQALNIISDLLIQTEETLHSRQKAFEYSFDENQKLKTENDNLKTEIEQLKAALAEQNHTPAGSARAEQEPPILEKLTIESLYN